MIKGLYMVQPYEPGKIPVLFIHGMWSSPMTWMEMFNDLRSSPDIRRHYQFWFYLYPTGAALLAQRSPLAAATWPRCGRCSIRSIAKPALDQMVLVGHSMGGLVARLQTLESGKDYLEPGEPHPLGTGQGRPRRAAEAGRDVLFPSQSLDPPRGDHRHALPRQQLLQRRHPMALRQADQPAPGS